jgi:hypothetical protein
MACLRLRPWWRHSRSGACGCSGSIQRSMTCYGFVASGFEICLNISSRAASPAHYIAAQATSDRRHRATRASLLLRPSILVTGHAGTICSLDDFTLSSGRPYRAAGACPLASSHKASNMAKLNPGSVAAIVLAGIVVLVLGAGSYMISSRLNRDAERAGNSASAPNAPGRINEQPMKDRTTPRQTEPPLVETNVPPAGR